MGEFGPNILFINQLSMSCSRCARASLQRRLMPMFFFWFLGFFFLIFCRLVSCNLAIFVTDRYLKHQNVCVTSPEGKRVDSWHIKPMIFINSFRCRAIICTIKMLFGLWRIIGWLDFLHCVMPLYQIDELNHCLGSLSASLSERSWVNMLPMHERFSMGRPIVPRVRQVVNCLLFPHYLSVTWTRWVKGTPHLFTQPEMNRLCWLVAVSCLTPVTSPSISAPAAIQPASSPIRVC